MRIVDGDLAVGDDADVVAERGDFLHDMAGKQHAAAGVFQLQNQSAQRARRHDVEAVRRLVEQHVLRVVHERAGERDLGALTLRKALGATVGKVLDLKQLE